MPTHHILALRPALRTKNFLGKSWNKFSGSSGWSRTCRVIQIGLVTLLPQPTVCWITGISRIPAIKTFYLSFQTGSGTHFGETYFIEQAGLPLSSAFWVLGLKLCTNTQLWRIYYSSCWWLKCCWQVAFGCLVPPHSSQPTSSGNGPIQFSCSRPVLLPSVPSFIRAKFSP